MPRGVAPARGLVLAATVGFAAFGAFWGVWGASVPRLRGQAGLEDAQLGVALLFIGAGALPAMMATGRALDRWGLRITGPLLASLGVSGVVVALTARGPVSLSAALLVVGVTSGAADVAINTVAGRAERQAGRPVITRAHAVFSTFVVIGSLGVGAVGGLGAPPLTPFVLVAGATGAAALALVVLLPAQRVAPSAAAHPVDGGARLGPQLGVGTPSRFTLIGFGVLGALAFASENAHQNWSAVFISDAVGTGATLSALAPAVFAAGVAVTRFLTGGLGPEHARVVLASGSAAATAGAVIVSTAPGLPVGLVGLLTAAAGTAVLFPTVLGVVSNRVDERHRGRATSLVATVSYLGFVLGPVYVGLWSGQVGIRGAMLAVAALGAVLLVATPLVKRSR